LRTTVADEHREHFTGLLIHLRHQPQLIRAARKTFHGELSKRAIQRRLAGLIIFPALKPSCGIHDRILPHRWDNGSPMQPEVDAAGNNRRKKTHLHFGWF
jgi:hypothetical protein